MSIAMTLTSIFGKAVANKLIPRLLNRPNGTQKMEAANAAMQTGSTVIEALKSVFGDDFPKELNAITGGGRSSFSYEAGIADYIKADTDPSPHPLKVLRDELNINLDRLNLMETKDKGALKNYFRGLFHIWKGRYQELALDHYNHDAKATFEAMDKFLDVSGKSFKDDYKLLSATGVGTIGALMLASGFSLITGTGVGIVTAISIFLFGIPWLRVGALILPGVLLLVLVAKHRRGDPSMSACVQLAYKLLDQNASKAH